jgi:hypothetical protein
MTNHRIGTGRIQPRQFSDKDPHGQILIASLIG